MQQDRIFEAAGLYIDKGEKAAKEKGVKELVKVHVEQPENQPGKDDCAALPIFNNFVADQFAKQNLLKNRGAQHREDGGKPERTAGYHIEERILHGGAFEQAHARSEAEADQIACNHKTVGHQESNCQMSGFHGMLFDGGCLFIPHYHKGDRKAQNIEGHHAQRQKDVEMILPLWEKCESKRLCADLHKKYDCRADEHADADA